MCAKLIELCDNVGTLSQNVVQIPTYIRHCYAFNVFYTFVVSSRFTFPQDRDALDTVLMQYLEQQLEPPFATQVGGPGR